MRDWLADGMIDHDPELLADLTGIEFGFVQRDGRDAIQISPKTMTDQAARIGLAATGRTCDDGDALALTFAYPVVPTGLAETGKSAHKSRIRPIRGILADERQARRPSEMSEKTQTYGEKAVGLSFNPSGDPDVEMTKRLYANVIDVCARLRVEAVDPAAPEFSKEKARLFEIAITEAQGAQMWAVKAITWKD